MHTCMCNTHSDKQWNTQHTQWLTHAVNEWCTHTKMHTHTCIHACLHAHMYTHTCTHSHTHTHTHTHRGQLEEMSLREDLKSEKMFFTSIQHTSLWCGDNQVGCPSTVDEGWAQVLHHTPAGVLKLVLEVKVTDWLIDHFHIALFSDFKHTYCAVLCRVGCDSEWGTVALHSTFLKILYPPKWYTYAIALFSCYMAGAMWNCCLCGTFHICLNCHDWILETKRPLCLSCHLFVSFDHFVCNSCAYSVSEFHLFQILDHWNKDIDNWRK